MTDAVESVSVYDYGRARRFMRRLSNSAEALKVVAKILRDIDTEEIAVL